MLLVISPAKTLDFDSPVRIRKATQPDFLEDSARLVDNLRHLTPDQLSTLMDISPALGELNHDRFNAWHTPFDKHNARQALFAFKGDVYLGLDAPALSATDVTYAQEHLRILSGLYGLLRPLDLIQPYRLEMGTTFKALGSTSLYDFWGERVTAALNELLLKERHPLLVNLASVEYYKVVREKQLQGRVISPVFKDFSNGQYKIVSFFAKKARGLMSAWILRNRLKKPEDLLAFDVDGYCYSAKDSTADSPVFLRRED
jgi:cytoplasmic iron level regulating protein YaaA (DUF328/UPF0246 family)